MNAGMGSVEGEKEHAKKPRHAFAMSPTIFKVVRRAPEAGNRVKNDTSMTSTRGEGRGNYDQILLM